MGKSIVLICTPLTFYTQNDEDMLFTWLGKIKSIKKIKGIGLELHLSFSSNTISNNELLDLMGIFERYHFDSAQLEVFKNSDNQDWFEKDE